MLARMLTGYGGKVAPPFNRYYIGGENEFRIALLGLQESDERLRWAGWRIIAAETIVRLPGGHYEPFMDGHDQAVEIQLSFLRRHLLDGSHDDH